MRMSRPLTAVGLLDARRTDSVRADHDVIETKIAI